MWRWSCSLLVSCHVSSLARLPSSAHHAGRVARNMCDNHCGGDKACEEKDDHRQKEVVAATPSKSPSSLSRVFSRGGSRSSMSGLLHMIAERKKPLRQVTGATKKTASPSPTSSGPAVLAGIFTSASTVAQAAAKQQRCRRSSVSQRVSVEKTSVESSQKPTVARSTVVSPTLVDKLRRNVRCKRIDWQQMLRQHSTLQRLPVWRQRKEWGTRFLSSSALSHQSADTTTDVFVCSAPTGSGKSSLVPLFLLDSHWTRLLQRIDASPGAESGAHSMDDISPSPSSAAPFSTTGRTCDFVTEFGASSRVCIVVSQPTRLACVELAKFTASLLASSSASSSSSPMPKDVTGVGGRVGYAVGGEAHFSSATEIIYATPGYIVSALQHKGEALSPTTLVIDEAHCRDMQTDLLLAWAKQHLQGGGESPVRLRQLLLMSATLPVEQMVTLFTSQFISGNVGTSGEEETGTTSSRPDKTVAIIPRVLLLESTERQGSEIGEASHPGTHICPYRIEEYFIDDLPDALETSHVFCGGAKNHSLSASSLPPILAPPARRVMSSLAHFFSYTRFGADIHTPQARALAQFLLFILQNLAMTCGGSVSNEEKDEQQPESILVFLPGFSEMSLVLQWLEMLCRAATPNKAVRNQESNPTIMTHNGDGNSSGHATHSEGVTFLQYEHWPFSVALLHATAIGSPQQQLRDTTGPFPHRIILSTTVAESSVTIPNVRCVVDSCLERHFFTDPLTGVMLRSTALASASSLRQRGGRTGRTCDGVVIHLAPRRIFGHSGKSDAALHDEMHAPHTHAMTSFLGRGVLSSLVASAQTLPESVTANAAAVLLRVKYLFPSRAGALVRHLPSPPPLDAIRHGVEQLVELGLLRPATGDAGGRGADGDDCREEGKGEENVSVHAVLRHYDNARLTAKGEFVAYLPIPHEQALLIYYALQFACVEEALLIACAMTVPTLLMLPRITAYGDNSETSTKQFLLSLETQRKLVETRKGGTTNSPSSSSSSCEERSDCHLSEPLMLRSLLCEWYACTNNADVAAFHKKYRVNRSALRLVDNCVAQCAARLHRLITLNGGDKNNNNTELQNDKKELLGEYDTITRQPSTQTMEQLIVAAFPMEYRKLLAGSLQRLRCCAMDHAAQRLSQRTCTMTHWYPHDEHLIRALQPSTNQKERGRRRRSDSDAVLRLMFGSVQQRLSAAFVAAFARNTMRGEDGSHRVHHKRLVRNLGALHEDVNNVCSFKIELHTQKPTLSSTRAALYDKLTVEELRRVLMPCLEGTCLSQLELFSNGKSAVACFSSNEKESEQQTNTTALEEKQRDKFLLEPRVLPFEQAVKPTLPTVTLAHIGISLLVSIQSALTRLTVLLPELSTSGSDRRDVSASNEGGELSRANCRKGRESAPNVIPSAYRGMHFSSVTTDDEKKEQESHGPPNVCVTWYDRHGLKRSLLLSDVRQAGYEELFPIPLETASSAAHGTPKVMAVVDGCSNNNGNNGEGGVCRSLTAAMPTNTSNYKDDEKGEEDENTVLSIHRVAFTHALYWKVTLPTVRVRQRFSLLETTSSSSSSSLSTTTGKTQSGCECYYCWVCHSAWMQKDAFYAHCRSVTHLTRLAFAVKHRMRREWVAAFSSGTLSNLLLRHNDGGMNVELLHCSVSPTSFLNALQWHPRSDDMVATMPIAIAGSLVANATNTRAVTPLCGSGSSLQALHVWVLDTDGADFISNGTTAGLPAGFPLAPSLFVLAGYLAAASSAFDAALLMNEDHSQAYAVMLYDWGVWRLPVPLTRTQLQSVLDVFAGKTWRGVPFLGDYGNGTDNDESGTTCGGGDGGSGETGSLHWCVISGVCPQCTYCGSGGHAEEKTTPSQQRRHPADETPSFEKAVESTILLVLHEYKNSRRRVVSFADYVQRVVAKLDTLSAAQERTQKSVDSTNCPNRQTTPRRAAASVAAERCGSAELLARFVARRQQQPLESLLRDIGCQFLSPPSADVLGAPKVSFRAGAMAAEEVTTEKLFLLPTMLPSYLPSPDFAAQLSRHRQRMRHGAAGAVEAEESSQDNVTSPRKLQKNQPQPSF